MEKLSLALDWTPNTNHTGFYVAQHKGWYREKGIELAITSPQDDGYAKTPARKLADGEVDLAIAPTESVLAYQTSDNPVDLIAIAALLAEDCSAIVTLQDSGIQSPGQLDGKIYASYGARFEDGVVKAMIRKDGGKGQPQLIYPDKLGIMNTLEEGIAHATWVFMPWEGVEVSRKGIALNTFKLADYGIPYGYSPVLISRKSDLKHRTTAYESFLSATERGFQFSARHPREAAEILKETSGLPHEADVEFLIESQRAVGPFYQASHLPWGYMEPDIWIRFVHWLQKEDILVDREGEPIFDIAIEDLFTNDHLPNPT